MDFCWGMPPYRRGAHCYLWQGLTVESIGTGWCRCRESAKVPCDAELRLREAPGNAPGEAAVVSLSGPR